jgi:uncharacterized membrane protein YdjX (TVP38/TMEM64 family)
MNLRLFLKAFFFFLIIGVLFYLNQYHLNFNAEDLQRFLASFGIMGPLVFVILFSLRPFILFPASVLAVAGGLAFGPFLGPVVTYVGSIAGALLSFLFIRKIGSKKPLKKHGEKRKLLQKRIEENGFFYIVSLRIIPVINFDLVSYLSALSKIKMKTYLAATMVGIIPGTIAFNLLGASIADLTPGLMAATAAVFAVALSIPIYVRYLLQKKNLNMEDVTEDK